MPRQFVYSDRTYSGLRRHKKITWWKMTRNKKQYRSVNITRLFMKIVGLWYVQTTKERWLLRAAFGYAIWAILFAILVESIDLYHCIDDFYAATSILCAIIMLILILVKLGSFMYYRDKVMELIYVAEVKFWNIIYDETAAKILEEYDELGMTVSYAFTLIVSAGTLNYIFVPILENRVSEGTDRMLPFKLWFEFPYHSPYYEIAYVVQSLSTIHSGICTFCFDNFISTFNIHVAAQLKILAHNVEIIVERYTENMTGKKCLSETEATTMAFKNLSSCVQQHLALIHYVNNMQCLFSVILLVQLLLSSVIMCFAGFMFLVTEEVSRKLLFALYLIGSFVQLFLYTWTCNDIIVQSTAISDAAFKSKWYLLSCNGPGKALRHGLIMIMLRTRKPCALTAGNFAVMSLGTFTGILSTAMSYFTLLRQMIQDNA